MKSSAPPGPPAPADVTSETTKATSSVQASGTTPGSDTTKFVRGSSLLLFGRGISVLLNLAVQVLIVRYLSMTEYGAFAYGLGVASIGSSMLLLGLGKAVPRFVPLYLEKGDRGRAFGTIVLATGTVLGLGAATVLALHGFQGVVAGSVVSDPLALSVLLILIAMAPLGALDNLLQNLAAVFVGARAILYRRHVLGPVLKLAAVLLVILVAGDVHLLAYGYVVGGLIGIWLYLSLLTRAWRSRNLLRFLNPKRFTVPAREIYRFSIPMMSAELSVLARGSVAVFLLEYLRTTAAVAEYRAVLPIAGLNMVVFEAFSFLFVPLASRMYARNDGVAVSDLFWRTSIWISVLTFPVLALTFTMAGPLAALLFGAEYAGSGPILALLALGMYVHATLGFNAESLRVYGRVRFTVISDSVAATLGIGLSIILIPHYGALGAAIGMTTLLITHSLINHLGLWVTGTGMRLIDGRFVRVHCITLCLLAGLFAFQQLLDPPLYQGVLAIAAASLLLIRVTRRFVRIGDTFPELLRIPLLRWLLA